MSTVSVRGGVGDLAADLEKIRKEAPIELRKVIREGIKVGNEIAKTNARRTAGSHGKHYPSSFTTEMHSGRGNLYSGEYGPDSALPQGGMSFEWGSRNQPPHLDLNKSADVIGPEMPRQVGRVLDRLFW